MRIVALAPNHWHGPWMNRQHLLSRLADQYEILYTNGPWSVWDREQDTFKVAPIFSDLEFVDGVKVDLPSRWLLRWPRFQAWDNWVIGRVVRRWKKVLSGNTPLIAYIFSPNYEEYLLALEPDYVVYHAYDRFSLFPDWTEESAQQQRKLTKLADLVIATSDNTADELRAYRNGIVHVLPNGVDISIFDRQIKNPGNEPEDLARIPQPRIGYVGTQNPKVDFSLIVELAKRHRNWNFVFVGRQLNIKNDSDFISCTLLSNVYFLGEKSRHQSPRYVLGMDVNIINYRVEESHWAVAGYPLKLHEYLAAGRPVVSCDLPALRIFGDVIDLCRTTGQWEVAIQRAIDGSGRGNVELRRATARENNWEQRVNALKGLLRTMVDKDK